MYVFVINNVKMCNGKMKFNVSSETINNMTNNIKEDLPCGKCFARFDIDARICEIREGPDRQELARFVKVPKRKFLPFGKFVHKISADTDTKRAFPLHLQVTNSIKVHRKIGVRRSRLYYLYELTSK